MPLTTEHILMSSVRDTLRWRSGPKPELNYLEAGYLRDMAAGQSFSLKYSPAPVRKILRTLIDCKCASVPYQKIDGVVADLVEITDYGKACLK